MNTIALVRNQNIDKKKWDQVIDSCSEATVYTYSWYLDALCPNWSALILGDYEFVMPLPWRKRFGITYVYPPYLIQRLGIYSSMTVQSEIARLFLEKLKRSFSMVDYPLTLNPVIAENLKYKVQRRSNYVLDISSPYAIIYAGYNRDAQKNLRKKSSFTVALDDDYQSILNNYLEYLSGKMKNKADFFAQSSRFQKLIGQGAKENKVIGLSVYKDNQCWGSALFLRNNDTAFYLMGVPIHKENKNNTLHLLIDGFIEKYAGKLNRLDFEGSDIPSIAYFFQKWGSENKPYCHIFFVNNPLLAIYLRLRRFILHQ